MNLCEFALMSTCLQLQSLGSLGRLICTLIARCLFYPTISILHVNQKAPSHSPPTHPPHVEIFTQNVTLMDFQCYGLLKTSFPPPSLPAVLMSTRYRSHPAKTIYRHIEETGFCINIPSNWRQVLCPEFLTLEIPFNNRATHRQIIGSSISIHPLLSSGERRDQTARFSMSPSCCFLSWNRL